MAVGLAEAVCTSESITQVGRLDEQHLGDTFRANYKRESWRGYAMGPPTVFRLVERHAGAYLGVEAIPQAWREKLENHQQIEDLAIKLAETI